MSLLTVTVGFCDVTALVSQLLPLWPSIPCLGEAGFCDVTALVSQVLPLRFSIPCLGDVVYLSKGLKYNLELLLFCEY